MRRQPTKGRAPQPSGVESLTQANVPPRAPDLQPPVPSQRQLRPQDAGDRIEAWLTSGGFVFFPTGETYDPRPDGFQLVCNHYVPNGRVGWLKQLRVAPFMPPVFAFDQAKDVVIGGGQQFAWPNQNDTAAFSEEPLRPSGHAGVWETPFGWEAYTDLHAVTVVPIIWRWHLRIVQGNIRTRPPFNFLDPATWYLAPDIPVPASVYPNGLPGAPPDAYEPQRMQVLQGDELTVHVFVPPDSTLCLFAEWHQVPVDPVFTTFAGSILQQKYGPSSYPLLPSFGQMSGYHQAVDRKVAMRNAKKGWQG